MLLDATSGTDELVHEITYALGSTQPNLQTRLRSGGH
jgi:hypothetical protein